MNKHLLLIHMNSEIPNFVYKLPEKQGVFVLLDSNGKVIFVESTENIKIRVLSYYEKSKQSRFSLIEENLANVDFVLFDNTVEAAKYELEMIQKHHPPLNRRGHDQKKYRFIHLTKTEKYPRVLIKKKILDLKKFHVIGPFRKLSYIKKAIPEAAIQLGIANCDKEINTGEDNFTVKTCIRRQTNQCLKPCEIEIDEEIYNKKITVFTEFFEKKNIKLLSQIENEMTEAKMSLNFEEAARLRDRYTMLKKFS